MEKKSSFFIVGKHAVIEALRNPSRKVLRVFLTEDSKKIIYRNSPKIDLLKNHKIYYKTKKELDKYCNKDDLLHQGFVAEIENLDLIDIKSFIKNKNNLNFVCLDDVSDPRNIGSIIRSAVSFAIDGIIVNERNFPNNSKLMYKSASGAMEYIKIFQVANIKNIIKYLKEKNFWVYGFDSKSKKNFTSVEWKGNNILLFGSEGFGIKKHTEKYADFLVKINISDKIESLNISNSAAIVFHHINNNQKKT